MRKKGVCQNSNSILAERRASVMLLPPKERNEVHWPMNCPHCSETKTQKRAKKTKLGYETFFCPRCRSYFNERTGTPFNHLEAPTDIVLLAVLWRLRYKLSLRDVAEMFLERGFAFTHETVRDREGRFAPLIADKAPRSSRKILVCRRNIYENSGEVVLPLSGY